MIGNEMASKDTETSFNSASGEEIDSTVNSSRNKNAAKLKEATDPKVSNGDGNNVHGEKANANHLDPKKEEKNYKKVVEKTISKGGLKSVPVTSLTHPLDRSITVIFVVTLFFTLLAIISGMGLAHMS